MEQEDPISIHALREESDSLPPVAFLSLFKFQSTPSARRATSTRLQTLQRMKVFQSTPSARRATYINAAMDGGVFIISIHALREESDQFFC